MADYIDDQDWGSWSNDFSVIGSTSESNITPTENKPAVTIPTLTNKQLNDKLDKFCEVKEIDKSKLTAIIGESILVYHNGNNLNGLPFGFVLTEHDKCKFKFGDLVVTVNPYNYFNDVGVSIGYCLESEFPYIKLYTDVLGIDTGVIIDDSTSSASNISIATEHSETNTIELSKCIAIMCELYNNNPNLFRVKYKQFYVDYKLHEKIVNIYNGDKTKINHAHKAVKGYDRSVVKAKQKYKRVDWNLIKEGTANSFNIPIDVFKSIVNAREGFKTKQLN